MSADSHNAADDQDWTGDGWQLLPSSWRREGGRDWDGASEGQVYRAARVRYHSQDREIVVRYVDAVREQTIERRYKVYLYDQDDGGRTILPRTVVDHGPASWPALIAAPDDGGEPATERDLEAVWQRWGDALQSTNASPPRRRDRDRDDDRELIADGGSRGIGVVCLEPDCPYQDIWYPDLEKLSVDIVKHDLVHSDHQVGYIDPDEIDKSVSKDGEVLVDHTEQTDLEDDQLMTDGGTQTDDDWQPKCWDCDRRMERRNLQKRTVIIHNDDGIGYEEAEVFLCRGCELDRWGYECDSCGQQYLDQLDAHKCCSWERGEPIPDGGEVTDDEIQYAADYVADLAADLDLSNDATIDATDLAWEYDGPHGDALSNRPKTIAAACVYHAALLNNEKRTQEEVSEAAGVSVGAIRDAFTEIKQREGLADDATAADSKPDTVAKTTTSSTSFTSVVQSDSSGVVRSVIPKPIWWAGASIFLTGFAVSFTAFQITTPADASAEVALNMDIDAVRFVIGVVVSTVGMILASVEMNRSSGGDAA